MSKRKVVTTTTLGFLSSIMAFLGLVGCCGFPVLAAVLAWLGIGAAQLSILSQYQNLFIVIALVAIAYGFFVVYLINKKTKDAALSCCSSKSARSDKWAKWLLWLSLLAVISTFFIDEKEEQSDNCCSQTELSIGPDLQD
ncbi:hypothetical protein EMN47_17365 [Prolixibacteraceae bacterium JC049]|nr:hypothetical protein [Prolixibacteraceae bacterium JC049]